ncbi:MAG: divergent polysaccharide deacetylase family protein [Candidatus Omnitrophica bacterium]|nr:divergent polysaccharide deacetylase family protein [Candidatus Omnitrophota bacterium]
MKKSRPVVESSSVAPIKEEDKPVDVVAVAPVKATAKKVATPSQKKSYVALVIDDWGYSTKNCQYLQSISDPITVAVLPSLPHSDDVMACAHKAGKEIVLHLPMEAHNNSDEYPPDYLLKTDMSPLKIDRLLSDTLDKMPLVSGVNNHMGSKATEDKMVMTTVFKQLKHRGLFFMDSKVTAKSVCEPLALQANLPFAARDVFLDNVNEASAIEKELEALVRLAKKHGKAIAIGHDRSLTLQVIEKYIPVLKEQGIELVTVKRYIKI